jgi:hypothetical protein
MVQTQEFSVTWLIKNRVGFFKQYTEATIENVNRMIDAANALINSSPHDKVAMIIDASGMEGNSAYIADIIKEFREKRADKWGFTVVIGAEGVIKFFAQLFFRVARIEARLADNIEEALDILRRIYPDLPTNL